MNVYDFDRTLYRGDASVDFWRWVLRHHPKTLCCLPEQLFFFGLWLIGGCGRTCFKTHFFSFLRRLPDVDHAVRSFWAAHAADDAPWYRTQRKETDCIISASPTFLVRACPWLPRKAAILGTEMDSRTGRIHGRNCRGEEKVRRLYERFPNANIERFYSDSFSDAPLATLAQEAFWVRHGEPVAWEEGVSKSRRVLQHFLSVRFLRFLFCGGLNVATGVGFAWAFALVFQVQVAFVLGYALSHVISYLLNAVLTFHTRPTLGGYGRYILAYIPNFLIQNALIVVLYDVMALSKFWTYLASAVLAIPITFLALVFYAFAKRQAHRT